MIKWLKELVAEYPDPARYDRKTLGFSYVSHAITPDVIAVFSNERHLFSYFYIDGVDAPKESRLSRWHKLFNESK